MKKNFNETAYSKIFFPQNDYIFFYVKFLKEQDIYFNLTNI